MDIRGCHGDTVSTIVPKWFRREGYVTPCASQGSPTHADPLKSVQVKERQACTAHWSALHRHSKHRQTETMAGSKFILPW